MDRNPYQLAVMQIAAAPVSDECGVRATRMLSFAHPETGQLVLDTPDALRLFGVANMGTVRRHLGRLQAAGVIHYNTNGRVYVTFLAWSSTAVPLDGKATLAEPRVYARPDARESAATRACTRDSASGPTAEPAYDAQPRADARVAARTDDANRASTRVSPPHPPMVGWYIDSLSDKEEPTNPAPAQPVVLEQSPVPAPVAPAQLEAPAPAPLDDYARNLALLADPEVTVGDPGVRDKVARAYSRDGLTHRHLLGQVVTWLNWLKTKPRISGQPAGALVYRCTAHAQDRSKYAPSRLTHEDRMNYAELLARHPLPSASEPEPEELPAPVDEPEAGPGEDWERWPDVLGTLSSMIPRGPFLEHIRPTRAQRDGDTVFVTAPSRASAELIDKRWRRIVAGRIEALVGYPLDVQVRAA